MLRRVFAVFAVGASALAPVAFAQPDLEGIKTEGIENAKVEPGDLVLRLGFTFGRADVPETVRMRLDAAAAMLANDRTVARIEVAGHTDAVGSSDFNQVLSEKRAEAVKAYLVAHGVAAERVSVVGYGEAQPRASNDTIEGRRLNRRVEIRITG
jgi:OOP family OmpA-OmpF porin